MKTFIKNIFVPFATFYGGGCMLLFIIRNLHLYELLHKEFLGFSLHNVFWVWGMIAMVGTLVISGSAPDSKEYSLFGAVNYWWDKLKWWAKVLLVLSLFSISFAFYVFISMGV